jgi:hypothetical protein
MTDKHNKRHLQLRGEVPIWHKENMVNLGIRKLLPSDWKAVAWIDADIEFENPTWAMDTLKILNGSKDIVQLFSHCVDMSPMGDAMKIFTSWGYQYSKGMPYVASPTNYWHPGYGWACTRKAYERMGGLFDKGILGSGDNIMALSFLQKGVVFALNKDNTQDYKDSVLEFQDRVKNMRFGYVPGVIRHYYHGTKASRNYGERWKILVNHKFCPSTHLKYDKNGLLIPTSECPTQMLTEILAYFSERNEDDIYKDNNIQEMLHNMVNNNDSEEEDYDDEDDPADITQQLGKMIQSLIQKN